MKQQKQARVQVCPALKHRKDKGEWAEIAFLKKAVGMGFTVCHPYGENHRFDFVVFARGTKAWRVQVKSSWVKSGWAYRFKSSGGGRHRYRRNEVDFMVVYVVPEDAWYVIPGRVASRHDMGYVLPHVAGSRGKYERYREAWGLLRGWEPGYGIELQACADTALSHQPSAVRQTKSEPAAGNAEGVPST